jgi:hypothetical protein
MGGFIPSFKMYPQCIYIGNIPYIGALTTHLYTVLAHIMSADKYNALDILNAQGKHPLEKLS